MTYKCRDCGCNTNNKKERCNTCLKEFKKWKDK